MAIAAMMSLAATLLACRSKGTPAPLPASSSREWTVTPGGGASWLPLDEADPYGDGDGTSYAIDGASALPDMIERSPRAALSIGADRMCALSHGLMATRERFSVNLDIMSPITDATTGCVLAVHPPALSFYAPRPWSPQATTILTHLDGCVALGIQDATDEAALLLGSRADSVDGAALRSIAFPTSRLSPAGLSALAKRTKLRAIGLRGLDVDSPQHPAAASGLAALGQLAELERLDLSYGPVTDADLAAIVNAKALRWVMLESTKITDAGIAHLATLSELLYLNLSFTHVTDAGVAQLARLPHLRSLRLVQAPITDDALTVLARMPELQDLNLANTTVTDVGLQRLGASSSLRTLSLPGTVSAGAVARWRKDHPKSTVFHEGR